MILCNCSYLKKKNILNNPDIVKNKIKTADIIYFCGGDSIKLVNDLKEYKIDVLLKEAISDNTVIAGMSAGAIMLCKEGYSDSLKLRGEADKYKFVEGLNFLNIVFCPHYKIDSDKAKELREDLKEEKYKVVCVEDKCAIKIINNNYELITDNKAYLCEYKKNFTCNPINNKGSIKDLI